jgi:hypothetical protein
MVNNSGALPVSACITGVNVSMASEALPEYSKVMPDRPATTLKDNKHYRRF